MFFTIVEGLLEQSSYNFYVYDPSYISTLKYEEFLQSVPSCKYNDGYEKARKIRDDYLLTMENNNG